MKLWTTETLYNLINWRHCVKYCVSNAYNGNKDIQLAVTFLFKRWCIGIAQSMEQSCAFYFKHALLIQDLIIFLLLCMNQSKKPYVIARFRCVGGCADIGRLWNSSVCYLCKNLDTTVYSCDRMCTRVVDWLCSGSVVLEFRTYSCLPRSNNRSNCPICKRNILLLVDDLDHYNVSLAFFVISFQLLRLRWNSRITEK